MTHAGLLLLAGVAAGPAAGDDPLEYVARMLDEAGWANRDGTPVTRWESREAAADTYVVLVRIGALTRDLPGSAAGHPTPDGAAFARAALRTWPAPKT